MLQNYKIAEMKIAVKQIGLDIKDLKKDLREKIEKKDYSFSDIQSGLHYYRKKARHLYVAYGLARGKTIESMEDPAKTKTQPSQKIIDKILTEYKKEEVS
jgi:hypothetical protein